MNKYLVEKFPLRLYVYLILFLIIVITVYPILNLIINKNINWNLINWLPSIILIYFIAIQITPLNNNYRNIHFISIVLFHTVFLFIISLMDTSINKMLLGNGSSYSDILKLPFISFLYINMMRIAFIIILKREPMTLGLRPGIFSQINSIYIERVERSATNYDFGWSVLNFIISVIIIVNII
jgi:hypothetical protein